MTSPTRLLHLRDAVERDLRENLLPFWLTRVIDERRGFHDHIADDGRVDPLAPMGGVLAARLLWTFSAVFRRTGDEACRRAAARMLRLLLERFWDDLHGGIFWMLDHEGRPLADRKQTYALAFALYALAEHRLATGDERALEHAQSLFRTLETRVGDPAGGGYFEARARDWSPLADVRLSERDLNAPRSMNTHLHLMEAYANLVGVWNDPEPRARLRSLVALHLERILDAASGHLQLFFDERFSPLPGAVSYGHDVEASWLLLEAAELVGDPALLERARASGLRLARLTLEQGFDQESGGVFADRSQDGRLDDDKHWWVQAEAIVGFLNAFALSADEAFLAAAERTWAFVDRFLIDREHGEWRWRTKRDGAPVPGVPKVEPWKCPYHNSRAALQTMARVDRLLGVAGED